MKKRILSMCIAVAMIVSVLPIVTLNVSAIQTDSQGWLWPVGGCRQNNGRHCRPITSAYGNRTIGGRTEHHNGIDIGGTAHHGENILATRSGEVIASRQDGSYGNYIIIRHPTVNGTRYYSLYAHLNTRRVSVGTSVQQGAVIGTMGNTGNVSSSQTGRPNAGAHLHFEISQGISTSGNYTRNQINTNPTSASKTNGNLTGGTTSSSGVPYKFTTTTPQNCAVCNQNPCRCPSGSFYPRYTGSSSSIVDSLSAVGVDSSYTHRQRIATANGISNYTGASAQNTRMLSLLKAGTLKKCTSCGGGTANPCASGHSRRAANCTQCSRCNVNLTRNCTSQSPCAFHSPNQPNATAGRIIDNSQPPTIFDALEILKFLVNMDGMIKSGGRDSRAWNAALITAESRASGAPTIFDVLEVLKYLVGMDSGITR